ncbi:hypothetical protein GcC1_193032 [Golovinomyces cichoracearum]|uniref:Uncharacterized protein n=1 Tax=Golovinomyces cichoracearum TaxID=62708 RepID=A0A420HHE7_9PEZI|nr:hypothetical protein GcC1_193032 [Golovinomyces cichoracearum]
MSTAEVPPHPPYHRDHPMTEQDPRDNVETSEDQTWMQYLLEPALENMLQELYKAITEKVAIENADQFTALKTESTKVKKKLEDL